MAQMRTTTESATHQAILDLILGWVCKHRADVAYRKVTLFFLVYRLGKCKYFITWIQHYREGSFIKSHLQNAIVVEDVFPELGIVRVQ